MTKKKILVLFGMNKTIPPVTEEYSGIIDLIQRPIEFLGNEDITVISMWKEGLENIKFNNSRYLHVKIKNNRIFKLIPYRIRKKIFGHGDPSKVEYYVKLAIKIFKFKPETIISHVDFYLAAFLSNIYPKAEHIFYYHGSVLENRISQSEWNRLSKKIQKMIVICEAAKTGIQNKFGVETLPIKVIMNGIKLDSENKKSSFLEKRIARAHFDLNKKDIVLIYAGRLVRTKGVDNLIKGFIIAYKQNNDLRLLIAGDPKKETFGDFDYFDFLKASASKAPDGVIKFLGWLNKSELDLLYKAGEISVLLSTKEGGEGNSLFLMESMVYGLACIATNVGGIPEVIGSAGILLNPENVNKELPRAILKLANQDLIRKYSELSRQRAEYFSYNRVARELIEFVYQEYD